MMFSELTDKTPVDCSLTQSGNISCNSWAITPSCVPDIAIARFCGNSVTSSLVRYSKLRTLIDNILSKPILLSTIFFFQSLV